MTLRAKVSKISVGLPTMVFLTLFISSCQTGQFVLPGQGQVGNSLQASTELPPAKGAVAGTGGVRVALLVPLTAPGNAGIVGNEISNAAKLAVRDFGKNSIHVIIRDTAGKAANAQTAAREALQEKSSAILGPLFSENVSAVSKVTLAARVPLIAFSSDPSRARRGVYLMSFSPQADIIRTLNYAVSQGNTRFVALLPNGAYGVLAEEAMKKTITNSGAQLVSLAKYDQTGESIEEAARSVAVALQGASAIYMPDGGKIPSAIIAALTRSGVDTKSKMVLGSGQWESADFTDPNLEGAYFAGRDKRQFNRFAARYKAAFGTVPSSTAGLAYDAVSMAAGLVRRHGSDAFNFANIESRNGYSGVNGIFRFGSNGKPDRGLVVYQIQDKKSRVVSQAPSTFGPGS